MKKMGDMLTRPSGFCEIVMGNTALVRAMIETGTRVVTSYPGSPTPEIALAIKSIPKEKRPFYFEFSTNEKVATEVAFGASVNGHLSTVFFKSVGLNVAADSFVQLSMMSLIGGMVVVLGDDPGANSSQNEQDNRHFARLAQVPLFEPASPSEVYLYYKEAAALSREMQMPVILRLTTHVCHAQEKVRFERLEDLEGLADYAAERDGLFDAKANGPYIPIASAVFPLKRRALERLLTVRDSDGQERWNRLLRHPAEFGVITSGLPFLSLCDVLERNPVKVDVLKLGMVHPLPEKQVLEFLRSHRHVKVLEELDDVLEQKTKALAFDHQLRCQILGKTDIESWIGEYTPDKVRVEMEKTWPELFLPTAVDQPPKTMTPRPPQLCPGCGHRSAFYAIKQALKPEDISVADIGCHTLGFLPPYEVGQVLLSMGHSTATAAGLSLFQKDRRVVAFLGDSTFFHAGLPGIINALMHRHNITLILMENGTTAMTGHQDHAGNVIPPRQVLEGLGVTQIWEVDTYRQKELTQAVEEALAQEGLKVVIARHPCMLKFSRFQRRKAKKLPKPVRVDASCKKLHNCVKVFGCPSYQLEADATTWVHKELCIGDRSCMPTCSIQAIVADEEKGGDEP